MPVHKSALRRMRTSQKRHARNVAIKSGLKTSIRKAEQLISRKSVDEAKEAVRLACSMLDKAATKGVIHPQKASRKKSRLAQRLSRLLAT